MTEEMKKKILEECNLDTDYLKSLGAEDFYDYLVNEYIPNQGSEDMRAFIGLSFCPYNYLMWKFSKNEIFRNELNVAIRQRIKEVFGF